MVTAINIGSGGRFLGRDVQYYFIVRFVRKSILIFGTRNQRKSDYFSMRDVCFRVREWFKI